MKPELKRGLLLAAVLGLTILVTTLLRVPIALSATVAGKDAGVYVTLGDTCVFLAVLLCGTPWGALIAAVGMALSDLIVGSYSYIIGSLLIKGGMALFIGTYGVRCNGWRACFRVAFLAEAIMVAGYFVYDLAVFGQYLIAAYEIPLNLLQGLVCGAAGACLLNKLPSHMRGVFNPSKRMAYQQPGAKRRVR